MDRFLIGDRGTRETIRRPMCRARSPWSANCFSGSSVTYYAPIVSKSSRRLALPILRPTHPHPKVGSAAPSAR